MTFELEPIYGSVGLTIGLSVLVVAVVVLVSPPTNDPRRRKWLIILRALAALMLMAVVVRPTLVKTDRQPAEAALMIAVDGSQSMTMQDGMESTRWQQQIRLCDELTSGFADLAERMPVEWVIYNASAQSIGRDQVGLSKIQQSQPDGRATSVAAPLEYALDLANRQPMVGLILLGDGTVTAIATESAERESDVSDSESSGRGSGSSSAEDSARVLDSIGVPLWSVPIGPPPQDADTRDVAVNGLQESYRVFAGNTFEVQFEVQSRGYSGNELPLQLRWVGPDGTVTEAAARRLVSRKAVDQQPVRVRLEIPPPGSYRLEVTALPREGERRTSNNVQVAFVDVQAGGGRLLVIDGQLRPEQFFLRLTLSGFQDFDLAHQWIAGDTRSRWPIPLGNALSADQFDVFILGDVSAEALGSEQLEQLANAVAEGAGLITMGGLEAYDAGGYRNSPLAKVLPIEMPTNPNEVTGAEAGQIRGPVRLKSVGTHPITQVQVMDTAMDWPQLPEMQGANRMGTARRNTPGVRVLLANQTDLPMLVVGEYGKGRVASLAIDETHLWYRAGQREFHQRFWRQLVLWLLAREDTDANAIQVSLDSRRFAAGQTVHFDAKRSSGGTTINKPTWQAEVIDESGNVRDAIIQSEVAPGATDQVNRDVEVSGQLPELEPGFYQLRVSMADEQAVSGEVSFQVIDENLELANPLADPVYLKQLASLTSGQGGQAYPPERVEELIENIRQQRRKSVTPVVDKLRLGDGPTSGWLVFLLFAGALSTEWVLRRRWGLV